MTQVCSGCKREFSELEGLRLSFGVCPDCGGTVVTKEADISGLKYATIFVADGRDEAEEVRRRLDINRISYVTRGDWESRKIYIDFLVREDKAEEAAALLKDIIDAEAVPEPPTAEDGQEVPHVSPVPKAVFDRSQTEDKGSNNVAILIISFAVFALLVILLNYMVKK